MQGKFITLEGIEGAGKSTNLLYIQSWLEAKGVEVVVTREPGGTEIGEAIREVLLNPKFSAMHSDTELLLMFAARAQHLREKIQPAIVAGKWVISDRFTDASYAYQGAGRGISFERIAKIENWLQQGFQPEITFIFDLPVETGRARAAARGLETGQQIDRFETEKQPFFKKIRSAYLRRAKASPARYEVLDANQSLVDVQLEIQSRLQAIFL